MSILVKKKATRIEEKLVLLPTNSREDIRDTINNFKKFVLEKHRLLTKLWGVVVIKTEWIDYKDHGIIFFKNG